jgi:hypothetical protein
VLTQNGWDNEFCQPRAVARVFEGKDVLNVSDGGDQPFAGFGSFSTQPGALVTPLTEPMVNSTSTPFSTKGIILEGLHPESVVTINLRVLMERVPTLSETDLVVLATPSPTYDELAWRFYSEAIRTMPIAVPLNENFTGGWFKGVAKSIGKGVKAVAPVAKVVAKHALPLAGPKGALAAKLIEDVEASERKRKGKQKLKAGPR